MTKTTANYYPFENGCGSDKLMVRDAMAEKPSCIDARWCRNRSYLLQEKLSMRKNTNAT